MSIPALLALADGSLFRGVSVGAPGQTVGEVVFNTSMTGYQEILTDPSYARQIITLTCPHIGNTGCNRVDAESAGAQAAGLVIRDLPLLASSWRSEETLDAWLRRNGTVAMAGIDTRRLTRILRERGAQSGCIVTGAEISENDAIAAARAFPGLAGMDLAQVVTLARAKAWGEGCYDLDTRRFGAPPARWRVTAWDFGVKRNMLRQLVDLGCAVTVVPARTPASEVLATAPDGVFLSNGPGDPEPCAYAVAAVRELVAARMPLFGICLGHQLLGLAIGARVVKLKFGHHGANHPVLELDTGRVMITSQNHGFAVDEASLPARARATHRSLFDGSLQGFELLDAPAFSFQGHPEASPGPRDVGGLFNRFVASMEAARLRATTS